ncbi:ImmA/IrrE family metallo-endopeptidase [Clostridium formicaceticum]|uniref:IrrE N-terminal-like domain-containing protein n=1 Tax=Clostridium formicaceticum TaxID=1497 RepID=A0AAC9RL92_9CLOT|nr:ImmA/IrrE family metallo-endopeptidase [Clostridium formicaceticum]AOY76658.1 hypothetical protein BJL90_12750 [Clostridium formicaceticum]ARE87083.1 hypothetical protein CLFO_14690 [Clostridium formicaceticum]
MNSYEKLLIEEPEIIIYDQADLEDDSKGFYVETTVAKVILISKKVKITKEKRCVLAEEFGHHYTTVGDITDQTKVENRKQELKARRWAVKRLIRVEQFIDAFKAGVRNRHELAEFLDVTEDFIETALDHFKGIYGHSYTIGEYTIFFSPLYVYKSFE